MKKWASIFCLFGLLLTLAGTATASEPPSIFINGTVLVSPNPPVIEEGRTLVPLAVIFDALGQPVNWHPEDSSISSGQIWLQVNNPQARVGDRTVSLDVPAQIINSRTYVPLGFIAASLGKEVKWDGIRYRIDIYEKSDLDFTVNTVEYGGGEIVAHGTFTNQGSNEITKITYVVIQILLIKDDGSYFPVEARFTDLALDIKPGESVNYALTFSGVPEYSGVTKYDDNVLDGEYVYKTN